MRVTHSLLHAEDLAELVQREYAVAAPVQVGLLNRGFNDTYLVTDADGERQVLRVYNREKYWIRSESDLRSSSTCWSTWPRPGWASSAPTSGRTAIGSAD